MGTLPLTPVGSGFILQQRLGVISSARPFCCSFISPFRISSHYLAAKRVCRGHNGHQDHNHHSHGHFYYGSHCHHGVMPKMNYYQEAVLCFARKIHWAQLADFLRDNLKLCCCSAALLLAAAASPYVLPKFAVKPIQATFTLIAFPLIAVSALLDAAVTILGGKVNIHVLMVLAAFISAIMASPLEGGLLLAMFNLSHIAEEYFTRQSKSDIKELKVQHPNYALVLKADGDRLPHLSSLAYEKVSVHDLEAGSYILVKAGEAVPVDGEICHGRSNITIEHLTGEVMPVERKVGDQIPGGAVNLDGILIIKVVKTWEESTLNRIVELTEEAHKNKPKLQRWLDAFGEIYSKSVLASSLLLALLGPFFFKWPFISTQVCHGSVYRALGFMVAASPCALAVVPLAYAASLSSCAHKGILLKGAHVLDSIASCHTVAFDKTGTLSTGELIFKAVEPVFGHMVNTDEVDSCCTPNCEDEALAVAAAMEEGATHPIGRAIVKHVRAADLSSPSVYSFENLPGRGISASLSFPESGSKDKRHLEAFLGSMEFIISKCVSDVESQRLRDAMAASAYTNDSVHAALSVDKKITLFHFEEKPRAFAAEVLSILKSEANLHVIMLTGDHELSARRVAQAVGIDEVHYSLQPNDKLALVKKFSSKKGGGLIMVGDGVNDAPAIAASTVGMVLAQHASGTALSAADVLLLQDDFWGILFCIAKAHQTVSLVIQNVLLALLCIVIAAVCSVFGISPLWLTVLLHEGGTLLVCLNSARARRNLPLANLFELDKLRESFLFFSQEAFPGV